MLKLNDVSISYSSRSKIIDKLTVSFVPGFHAIVGPNGAGKSTLLRAIFGLMPYSGEVYLKGKNMKKITSKEKLKLISYLPQEDLQYSELLVMEVVLLGKMQSLGLSVRSEQLESVMEVLNDLGIASIADRPYNKLSGGQKKLVHIAQALVKKPYLVLMDEPTNSLDIRKKLMLCELLRDRIKNQGINIIVVLHDLNLAAQFADTVTVISPQGKLFGQDSANNILTPSMLREIYKVDGMVHHINDIPYVIPTNSIP